MAGLGVAVATHREEFTHPWHVRLEGADCIGAEALEVDVGGQERDGDASPMIRHLHRERLA
jgi:hypothetical protein